MLLTRIILWVLSVGLVASGVGAALGQGFPNRPIRIVTSPPGGSSDFSSRQIAHGLTESLGQQVIVENRGDISGEVVAKALPDGYTLLIDGNSIWVIPLMRKVPYDVVRDFSPITLTSTSPYLLVVHPSVPVNSVKELIDLAKAKPGTLNYSSGPAGGGNHLAMELIKYMARVNIVRIAYKGSGPASLALVAGEVQTAVQSVSATMPHVKSGKLRALGVTSAQPTALIPGIPTVASGGLPGYEITQIGALFAPAKTPAAIITKLNQETVRVLNRPDVKERFFKTGVEVLGSTTQEFAATMKSDMATWGKVMKEAGIKDD